MNRRKLFRVVAALLVVACTFPARAVAWGPEGHRIVGFIAEEHLTPAAKAAIAELLSDGQRISDDEVANWADHIRNLFPESGPWHYVDIPVEAGKYDPKRDCKYSDCVIARIERFKEVLKDKKAKPIERQRALKFLVHFVGDMHQPLHCAERKNNAGSPDRGGNDCKVHFLDQTEETNLHRVWDSSILKHSIGQTELAEYAKQLNSKISDEDVAKWSKGGTNAWANESFKAAVAHVYKGVPADGPPTRLDAEYVSTNAKIVDGQLSKAAIRLAKVLNEAFGE